MKNILVFGSTGQLSQEIREIAKSTTGYTFEFIGKDLLDLGSKHDLDHFFKNKLPKNTFGIINAAAYTAVDLAESNKEKAYSINSEAPAIIAEYSSRYEIKLIHISTDFVFDGLKSSPYFETDSKNPLSVYGKSKSEGEELVLNRDSNSIIIRTSWVYSKFGNNFLNTMIRLSKERNSISVVDDQIGSPTWAGDLAGVCIEALSSNRSGIYHFSNEGVASWYDFAYAIISKVNPKCKVLPIPSELFPTPAIRPTYSVMSKKKFRESFLKENFHWKDRIELVLNELR
ncbi:dTDP-4-dehydrorhamnose reductase [Leptospira yanagawae serovar Saopaulo str. Sao Paulo = ATCC 700523]|uniref:dTDP-4-dehydrorhamnose reductase n=1 Tax=Leptospira yanagawae serovar Saopaulo str. Sao Paulo = ATCC 700523 TaxID=1249483 RepID=A0A5E8HBH0_9LEPT|nr:dTDP-4-dehydrorhamnose reductase [Leptospira yanagawae]EOQ87930.1 dTDP-4-dehydrorhamnose reductase [Leptospira yanagawae serovar Saopaulo str. Sao Paulo = ATCC 700523]